MEIPRHYPKREVPSQAPESLYLEGPPDSATSHKKQPEISTCF